MIMRPLVHSRTSVLALVIVGLLTATAAPAYAQAAAATAGQTAPKAAAAETFIRKVADEAMQIIRDKSVPSENKKAKLNSMFNQNVAMDYIATLALGRYARIDPAKPADVRSKQAAQIAEYRERFPDFMFNKLYDILISKFDNSTIEVIGSKPIGATDLYVNTRVIRPGQETVLADWRVRADKTGTLKVIDLKAEGVSLTITQRDEFAAILGTSSDINESLAKLLAHMSGQPAPQTQAKK